MVAVPFVPMSVHLLPLSICRPLYVRSRRLCSHIFPLITVEGHSSRRDPCGRFRPAKRHQHRCEQAIPQTALRCKYNRSLMSRLGPFLGDVPVSPSLNHAMHIMHFPLCSKRRNALSWPWFEGSSLEEGSQCAGCMGERYVKRECIFGRGDQGRRNETASV